jgi:hypothetical protein
VTANDVAQLAQGIAKGGSAGVALAVTLTNSIANARATQQPGTQLNPQLIDGLIAQLPQDQGSTASLSNYLRTKLIQLKNAPPHR